jgi:hypothetical protein
MEISKKVFEEKPRDLWKDVDDEKYQVKEFVSLIELL